MNDLMCFLLRYAYKTIYDLLRQKNTVSSEKQSNYLTAVQKRYISQIITEIITPYGRY